MVESSSAQGLEPVDQSVGFPDQARGLHQVRSNELFLFGHNPTVVALMNPLMPDSLGYLLKQCSVVAPDLKYCRVSRLTPVVAPLVVGVVQRSNNKSGTKLLHPVGVWSLPRLQYDDGRQRSGIKGTAIDRSADFGGASLDLFQTCSTMRASGGIDRTMPSPCLPAIPIDRGPNPETYNGIKSSKLTKPSSAMMCFTGDVESLQVTSASCPASWGLNSVK